MGSLRKFARRSHLGTVTALFIVWWIAAKFVNHSVLPFPQEAFFAFFLSMKGELLRHIGVSFYRVFVSMLLAVVTAVPLGMFLGKNPQWNEKFAPAIYLTYPIPKVVLMPIMFILLGIGDTSKIALITLIVFYQILVATRDAARNLSNSYVTSVESLGADFWELYRHVFFPGCLPEILTSLRIGLGTAMAVLFLAETYATQQGLGFFIMDALSRMDYHQMFAGIIAMSGLGLVLYFLVDGAEKWLCPWKGLN